MTAFADADMQRWHLRAFDSRKEAMEWVDAWVGRWEGNTDASWAVTRAEDDVVLGCVSLRTLFPHAATAQISYWTLPAAEASGRGDCGDAGRHPVGVRHCGPAPDSSHAFGGEPRLLRSGYPRRVLARGHPARLHAACRRLA
jgi:hypothetical protein